MGQYQFANRTTYVHDLASCGGEFCVIHNPSRHHMRYWPLELHTDKSPHGNALCYRVCPHALKHPDPDSVAYFTNHYRGLEALAMAAHIGIEDIMRPYVDLVHECDGCCTPREEISVEEVISDLQEVYEVTR